MTQYLILFGAGLIAGTLNVVAGGGSFLTLPILMFMGLPAGVANGTNRVGILLQNVGAVWSFDRHGVLDWRYLLRAAVPATLGGLLGTWAALLISDQAFRKILAFLMVGISLWTIWNPKWKALAEDGGEASPVGRNLILALVFFAVGIYGGFVQAGVGFFLLGATTLAGLDLVRGNAVKVLTVLCLTTVALALFAWNGKVDWLRGFVLAGGTTLGGLMGARLTVLKGHKWIRGVVTITVIVFALKLWFAG